VNFSIQCRSKTKLAPERELGLREVQLKENLCVETLLLFDLLGFLGPLPDLCNGFLNVRVIARLTWINERFSNLTHNSVGLVEEFTTFLRRKFLLLKDIH
jgi:hypothetical protein